MSKGVRAKREARNATTTDHGRLTTDHRTWREAPKISQVTNQRSDPPKDGLVVVRGQKSDSPADQELEEEIARNAGEWW